MKRYFIHHPLFRLIAPVIYGVLIYLLILLINNNVSQVNDLFSEQELYVCIGLSGLSFESIRLLILLIDKYLSIRRFRMLIQFAITTLLSVTVVLIAVSLYFRYGVGFSISGSLLLIFATIFIITALLYNILYFSNHYLQQENILKLQAERQQREVLEMEMAEFKNDINPDLLYECLENLIALMHRDVELAETYIDCLASAYRYVLTHRRYELVPVTTELEAAHNLVRLLNEKYNGQLRFEPQLDESSLRIMLIPGSLPVIIEYMVRNTIITRFEPFIIRCYVEDDYLVMQCPLNDRLIPHPESDLSLSRLQRSYSLYSDLPSIKVKAHPENYIKLPVISVPEEVLNAVP